MNKETITITLTLSEGEIKPGDLFFFPQVDGLPTIRQAKEKEDWNGWTNSKTGENPYKRIERIEGVVLSPRDVFGKGLKNTTGGNYE